MYVFKYVMIYMWYFVWVNFYSFMYCNVMCLCICQPPSIPNFQILLLSIVFKIYSHEAEKFNCYPTEDWYSMSWNSLYGSQVFVQIKSDYLCISNSNTITWDFCAEFHTSTITYLENKWEFISLVRIVKCVCWKQLDDYLFIRICVLMCCWDVFTSQIYSEKDSLILYIYPTQKTRHNQSTQNTFYNDNFFLSPTRVNTSHCIANTAMGRGHGRAASIL